MIALPDPRKNRFLTYQPSLLPALATRGNLAEFQAPAARRDRARLACESGTVGVLPVRWLRPEPRPSVQYAGHMTTTAARDRRLTPQSKAMLQILRARCGNGTRTATDKTTLADIMGVCARSIQRYVAELVRFGYIETRIRRGRTGLYVGLLVGITEKVLPCFRRLPWLAGWLAQNLATSNTAERGGNPDRTELSPKNHSYKECYSKSWSPPDG